MDGRVTRHRRAALWTSWMFAIALLAALPSAAAVGQNVQVHGVVVDPGGRPLAGATVVLEASRTAFRLLRLKRQTTEPVQLPVTTDANGRYVIDWRHDRHFTNFDLLVALPVRKAQRDAFEVFLRQDISAFMETAEGSLLVQLVVEDSNQLAWLRRFLDGQAHADEDRIFSDMGRPDRLDHDEVLGESSWWYFASGKVYHFRDGALDQVTHFDPVVEPSTTP